MSDNSIEEIELSRRRLEFFALRNFRRAAWWRLAPDRAAASIVWHGNTCSCWDCERLRGKPVIVPHEYLYQQAAKHRAELDVLAARAMKAWLKANGWK